MKIGTSAVAVGAVVATMLLVKPWTKAQSSLEINSPIKVNTDSSEPASEVGRLIPDPKIIQSHDEFLKKVEAARAVRLTRESQGNTRSKNATEPQTAEEAILDSDYIQTQLKELEPLFLECYNKALRHDSAAGGRLSIMLSIAGDSTVGGIIAESNIVDDSEESIADPEFRLCVQESMYAARFPPPKGSGEVKLTKPLRFFFHSDDNENQPK